jgi:hypothetical protein
LLAVSPRLLRRPHDAPDPKLAGTLACAGSCPVTIFGHYHGYPVVGIAFSHLVIVRNGHPPAGAVPVPRLGHAHQQLYYLGSEIDIGAVSPDLVN